MSDAIKRATMTLFPSEGEGACNVKFFPGHSRNISAEDLADEFNRAEAQLKNGLIHPKAEIEEDLTPQTVR